MTAMENATRELMGIIADKQLAVAPARKDASPDYWEQRGKWEGLEIAYGIVKKWVDDNAYLLKGQKAETIECEACGHRLLKEWVWCPWCGWETVLKN